MAACTKEGKGRDGKGRKEVREGTEGGGRKEWKGCQGRKENMSRKEERDAKEGRKKGREGCQGRTEGRKEERNAR